MESPDFDKFLAAVRNRDQPAAETLVRRYEPYLRRIVRLRLHDSRLRRLFDSMDICQSIMASFFAHATAGEFEIRGPEQLRNLLVRMALNKLATKARAVQKEEGGLPADWDAIDPRPTPAETAEAREFLQVVQSRLSEEELLLFELNKVQKQSWEAIARERGGQPDALRMRLARGLARVRHDLEREGLSHVH